VQVKEGSQAQARCYAGQIITEISRALYGGPSLACKSPNVLKSVPCTCCCLRLPAGRWRWLWDPCAVA
jgi:hypothetical protein